MIIKPNEKIILQSLSTHLNSVNRGEKFMCSECNYEATHRSNLATHMKAMHRGQKFYVQSVNMKQLGKNLLLPILSIWTGEKCLSVQSVIMR